MNDFSPMRAYLLAGGRGERLRPLTDRVPKCLAPVGGRPLLAYWLTLCRREGVTDVLLNVSHHFEMVEAFLASWPEPTPRVTRRAGARAVGHGDHRAPRALVQ